MKIVIEYMDYCRLLERANSALENDKDCKDTVVRLMCFTSVDYFEYKCEILEKMIDEKLEN